MEDGEEGKKTKHGLLIYFGSCNSSSRGYDAPFRPTQALHADGAQAYVAGFHLGHQPAPK